METEQYVVGVDGGNTKTIALVSAMDGTVLGVGRGGCSDIYTNRDPEVPLAQLEIAVYQALSSAGIRPEELVAGVFSLAGADWPEDFTLLETALRERGFGRKITVVNDAVGALRAGSAEGPAVVVVCGTGAATAARSTDGRVWHSSWWQDPQGAHHLGEQTLRAVYRAEIGVDPPTALSEAVLGHFGQSSIEDVLHILTARGSDHPARRKVAGLARVLLDVAESGDLAAREIVGRHGASLGDYALAAARQVGIGSVSFALVLSGGVLRHESRLLTDALVERVQATSPGVEPAFSPFEPAAGALFMALESRGRGCG